MVRYNTHIRVGTGSTAVVLPVSRLAVRAEPYSPSGASYVELFDGRRVLAPVTWGYRAEIEWAELRQDHAALRQAVQLLTTAPRSVSFVRLPDGTWTATVPDMIPELDDQALALMFESRARVRPARLQLLSTSRNLPLYEWLTH